MIMLHGLVWAKMGNKGFAVAKKRQKSWFDFDLSQDAQPLFTFKKEERL
jgi:hypothetical protein